jgi:hypothetical protein
MSLRHSRGLYGCWPLKCAWSQPVKNKAETLCVAPLLRAPREGRCLDSAQHGRWQTTISVDILRHHPLTALIDGKMFLAYVHQFLWPTPANRRHRDPLQSQYSHDGERRGSDHDNRAIILFVVAHALYRNRIE